MLTRAEAEVVVKRLETYPAGWGKTYIAGTEAVTASLAVKMIGRRPTLEEDG